MPCWMKPNIICTINNCTGNAACVVKRLQVGHWFHRKDDVVNIVTPVSITGKNSSPNTVRVVTTNTTDNNHAGCTFNAVVISVAYILWLKCVYRLYGCGDDDDDRLNQVESMAYWSYHNGSTLFGSVRYNRFRDDIVIHSFLFFFLLCFDFVVSSFLLLSSSSSSSSSSLGNIGAMTFCPYSASKLYKHDLGYSFVLKAHSQSTTCCCFIIVFPFCFVPSAATVVPVFDVDVVCANVCNPRWIKACRICKDRLCKSNCCCI